MIEQGALPRCERCRQFAVCVDVDTGFAGESEPLCGPCVSLMIDELESKLDRLTLPRGAP